MRRSRSPIRFKRERSPSIVSIHSREPSRERSFSISSLSSCSLGQSFNKKRDFQQNSGPANRRENQNIDLRDDLDQESRRNKRHGKSGSNKRQDRGRRDMKEIELERSDIRSHDSHFSRGSNRIRQGKPKSREQEMLYSDSHRQNEEMLDPSVSLQEQAAFQLQSAGLEFEQRNSNRLDRLEKMLEKILQKNTLQQQQQQPSSSGFMPENSENPCEFNPRNTSFTTSLWLNKVNEECIEKNFDEKTCIQFMQSRMSGLMKAWIKTLDIFEYSWPELKMLIIRTFPDNLEFSNTLRMLVDRYKQPEESITQYYFSKMYLLEACKITGANAVSCLIDGLTDAYLQQEAKGHNFLTPETLYSQFFTKLPNFGIQQPRLASDDMTRDIGYLENSNIGTDLTMQVPRTNISAPAPPRVKKCYTCKKFGHIAVECRHAPLCYRCNKEGHIAVKCPKIKK